MIGLGKILGRSSMVNQREREVLGISLLSFGSLFLVQVGKKVTDSLHWSPVIPVPGQVCPIEKESGNSNHVFSAKRIQIVQCTQMSKCLLGLAQVGALLRPYLFNKINGEKLLIMSWIIKGTEGIQAPDSH